MYSRGIILFLNVRLGGNGGGNVKYKDETIVMKPSYSKDELKKQIEVLEIKNYGHVCVHKDEKTEIQRGNIFDKRKSCYM